MNDGESKDDYSVREVLALGLVLLLTAVPVLALMLLAAGPPP